MWKKRGWYFVWKSDGENRGRESGRTSNKRKEKIDSTELYKSSYLNIVDQRHKRCFTTAARYVIVHLEQFNRFSMCAQTSARINVPFFVLVLKPLSLLDLSSNITCIWFSRFYLCPLHICMYIDIHFFRSLCVLRFKFSRAQQLKDHIYSS